MEDAIRSCERGKGLDQQCPALDLRQLETLSEIPAVPGGPLFPAATVVLFSQFACREVEAALRKNSQIVVDCKPDSCGVVSFYLPASKTDPSGEGVLRRVGYPGLCPVKAARKFFDHHASAQSGPDAPFLATDKAGLAPSRTLMVNTFRAVAQAIGWEEIQCKAITGHLLRCTGAQFFARCAVEYYKIQLFCRWGSDTILRYWRKVPLEGSENWLSEAQGNLCASLDEHLHRANTQVKATYSGLSSDEVNKLFLMHWVHIPLISCWSGKANLISWRRQSMKWRTYRPNTF